MTELSHLSPVNLYPWLDRLKPSLYAHAPVFTAIKRPFLTFIDDIGYAKTASATLLGNTSQETVHMLRSTPTLLLSALLYLRAHPGLLIVATLFSTWFYALYMSRTRSPVCPRHMAVLGALLIPTTSRWPSYYTARMRAALRASRPLLFTSTPKNSGDADYECTSDIALELDMDTLFADIAAGRIELRSPDDHLQTLLAGRDIKWHVRDDDGGDGWSTLRIRLIAGFSARFRAWYADIASRALPVSEDEAFATLVRTPTHALLDLDVIPPSHVPALLTRLPRNTRAVLLLSSASIPYSSGPSTAISRASTSLPALSAYPFIHPRSPSALRTQLPDLLHLLSEAGATLEKVEDAGEAYANALINAADTLEGESIPRGAFVAEHEKRGSKGDGGDDGMRVWRAEVLRGRWEAALVRAGSVRKWAVSVRT